MEFEIDYDRSEPETVLFNINIPESLVGESARHDTAVRVGQKIKSLKLMVPVF